MEVEDYFVAETVTNPGMQAITARDYLAPGIKKRIMVIRLNGNLEECSKFQDWVLLKTWLFQQYGKKTTTFEADDKIDACRMRESQSVQDFVNYFETLLPDVSWGYEENATFSNFRKKLTEPILDRIYDATGGKFPATYPDLKEAAYDADEFIRSKARLFKRKVDFILPTTTRGSTPTSGSNSTPQAPRRPLGESTGGAGNKRKQTQFPELSSEQRKKLRDEKRCFKCGKSGHFASNCEAKDQPSR
jgi:hypothetical protein